MKLDAGPEAGISYGLHDLPKHIMEADPPCVCVSLGDKYQDVPPRFTWHLTSDTHIMNFVNKLNPPSIFGGFFAPFTG